MGRWMDGTTLRQNLSDRWCVGNLCGIHGFAFNYAATECELMCSWSLLKFCLFSEDSLAR